MFVVSRKRPRRDALGPAQDTLDHNGDRVLESCQRRGRMACSIGYALMDEPGWGCSCVDIHHKSQRF